MNVSLFKYIPFQVGQLVANIETGALALPDIQRPFVWPQSKVRDLLDSMYKGFPVGQLMFWQTGADPGIKQIGIDKKPIQAPYHLIVDGQQRLTSLYAVVTGEAVLREDFTETRIKVAFNPWTEQFIIPDATTSKNPEWLPDITALFGSFLSTVEGYLKRIAAVRDVSEEEREHIFAVFDRVRDLNKYQFSVVELDATADEEQVAEVFVRTNSEGVVLNQADFILTLMSVFWEKGRKQLEEFTRASKVPSTTGSSPFNWYLQPQPAQLLRVSAALAFRRARLKHVYAALRGRDLETGKPVPDQREQQFELLATAQDDVLELTNWLEFMHVLDRAGYKGSKMISSENAIMYTYALWLIGLKDCGVSRDELREVMARWFFMVSITARYSASFESQMERDLEPFREELSSAEFCRIINQKVADSLTNDFWEITLPNELSTSASRSPALLAYIAALNILDAQPLLSTGSVRTWLDPAVSTKKGIERHHLFPRNYLKNIGVTKVRVINQIANMALVEWTDNIEISDEAPSDYWPRELEKKNFSKETIEQQMYWHALPKDWHIMEYDEFLQRRRQLMAGIVKDAFDELS